MKLDKIIVCSAN